MILWNEPYQREKLYRGRLRRKADFRTGQVYYPPELRKHLMEDPPGYWQSFKAGLRRDCWMAVVAFVMWALASLLAWIMFAGGKP